MVGLLFNGIEKKNVFVFLYVCVCVFGFFYFGLHLLNSDNRKCIKIKKIKMKNELC